MARRRLAFLLLPLLAVLLSASAASAALASHANFSPFSRGTWRDVVPSRRKCAVHHTAAAATATPNALCFERISDIQALYLQQVPGTNRAVVSTQHGLMQLVTLPAFGSRRTATVVGTWLDLTSRVTSGQPEQGLLSFAFHPDFLYNGRFFVSYICDSNITPDCKSWCACNPTTGCQLGSMGSGCNFQTIVAEYKAVAAAGGRNFSTATHLAPREVRRYLNFGRPFQNHNGGHIFFGKDGFLYYTSGDGGNEGDPFNMAQRTNTFLGKILRIDVSGVSPGKHYRIPPTNPFVGRAGVLEEIFALGLRNPWRCDQDPVTGMLVCGDVGQDKVEEVDIILPGHNYLWHNYEGTFPYTTSGSAYTSPSKMAGAKKFPIWQYLHSCDSQRPWIDCVSPGYVAVIGGVVYRAIGRNKCLQGKYLVNDVSGPMWVGTIYPPPGQPYAFKRVTPKCTADSALPCLGGGMPALGSVWSWAKDRNLNAYALSNLGIFRVVELSRCGIRC